MAPFASKEEHDYGQERCIPNLHVRGDIDLQAFLAGEPSSLEAHLLTARGKVGRFTDVVPGSYGTAARFEASF